MTDSTSLPAFDIVSKFHALLFVEQPFESALEAVDVPVAQCEKPNLAEGQHVEEPMKVRLVAGDATGGVGQNHANVPIVYPLQQRSHAGALSLVGASAATDSGVGKLTYNFPALPLRSLAACLKLLIDRVLFLTIRTVASIYDRAQEQFLSKLTHLFGGKRIHPERRMLWPRLRPNPTGLGLQPSS